MVNEEEKARELQWMEAKKKRQAEREARQKARQVKQVCSPGRQGARVRSVRPPPARSPCHSCRRPLCSRAV